VFRRHSQLRTTLFVLADVLTTAAALVLAYVLRFASGWVAVEKEWHPEVYLRALPPAVLLGVATYSLIGNYRSTGVANPRGTDLRSTVGGVLAATLLLATGALFYGEGQQFSRLMLVIFPIVAAPLVWTGRLAALRVLRALHRRGTGIREAVLAGAGPVADALERSIAERDWLGIRIVERVESPAALAEAVERAEPSQVFLAFPADRHTDLAASLSAVRDASVDVRVLPDLGGEATLNPEVALIDGLPMVTLRQTPLHGVGRYAKRLFDVVAGLVLAALLLPVALVAALLVLLGSGRPVFYSQVRTGLDGRSFSILKFRTMRKDAEAKGDAVWGSRDDPRATAVGRFLRRFSLDEIPQLLNVLKGEMSLVGPRPERPAFVEEFRKSLPGYMRRLRIPAGLTGLAQVKGLRGDTDLKERLRLDLHYLERWSLLYDVEILLRTAGRVLLGR
jgi:exopolysaccharide biosynthesis polyprenyl glycosylphosphotransferase